MGKKIDILIEDKIATIKLLDPDNLNPLNKETAILLLESLESLEKNNDVRCVIITGSGRAFSAGGDIKLFKSSIEDGTSGKVMDDLLKNLYKIALILRLYPKPVIAS
ncbi:MAG: enoyl-CoA hydratase/isomerase family protein, partial [Promethearchaeota archaeon]